MSKQWEYEHEDTKLTVFANSRGEALARLRDKLGRRRLPKGSKVLKCGQNKAGLKLFPPFTIQANRTFIWNSEAVDSLPDLEAVKEAGDWDVSYLIRDSTGTLVTSKRSEQDAKDWIAEHDTALC